MRIALILPFLVLILLRTGSSKSGISPLIIKFNLEDIFLNLAKYADKDINKLE